MKTTKYTITQYKGVLGDFATEYWTEKDWENHRQYIDKLKAESEYMKPYKVTSELINDPIYDSPSKIFKNPTESLRMDILDLTKINIDDIKRTK